MCELSSPEIHLPRETDCGIIGSAEPVYSRRRPCRHRCLELTVFGFPGVAGDGMPGKNVQRKLGTTRGSPRRSRTAKASRISQTVKSRCAREWGGWGRLSDDGPGHYNPDPSEGPWGRWSLPPHGGAVYLSLIHISEPTRLLSISYAVFCDPGKSEHRQFQTAMSAWPSPQVNRLGTPKDPAIRFTREVHFGAT